MDMTRIPRDEKGDDAVAAETARAELRRRGYSNGEVDGMIKGTRRDQAGGLKSKIADL